MKSISICSLAALFFRIFFLFLVIRLLPAALPEDAVSGTWDLTVESSQGNSTPSIVLEQEGNKLSGTYQGRTGDLPLKGSLSGNKISFSITLKFPDKEFVVVYNGTVDGDSMSGTVQFGDSGGGKWTGRRR